jgi:hypothetical protein
MCPTRFYQNQVLGPEDLTVTFYDSTYWGGTLQDGTYIGGTYGTRFYNPNELTYRIWNTDTIQLVTYGFCLPYSMETGTFYANTQLPDIMGHYQIQWYSNRYAPSPLGKGLHVITQNFEIKSITERSRIKPLLKGVRQNLSVVLRHSHDHDHYDFIQCDQENFPCH